MARAEPVAGGEIDFFHGQPYRRVGGGPGVGVPGDRQRRGCFRRPDDVPITTYRDAEAVLRDGETFSSTINAEHIGQFMGDLILAMDGAEHRQYRNLVAKAFRASQLEQWDDTLVRPTINRLLDAIAPAGRADLVAAVTSKYPVQVICGIVGVPLEDAPQFHAWAEQINTGPLDPEAGHAASAAMVEYLRPLVEARRVRPTGDFLSDLVHAEVDGEQLSESKLYGFLRLLLPAGAETTFRVMGNCLFALLTHPDALAAVTADRYLLPEVIEETLRWETSVTMVSRVAAADTEVAGCPIPAGSPVGVLTGSANRDETRWDDPDDWRLGRAPQHHLAFGTGQHQCLGMHLARLELRAGLDAILDRLPNLRLDPDADLDALVIEGYAFRGPVALPVCVRPGLITRAGTRSSRRGVGLGDAQPVVLLVPEHHHPLLACARPEDVVRLPDFAERRRRRGRVEVARIEHGVIGDQRELLSEAFVERFGVAAGQVGATAAVEEQRVARHELPVDVEALRPRRVARRVDQRDAHRADFHHVAGRVRDEIGVGAAGDALHAERLRFLHVHLRGDVVAREQLGEALDAPAAQAAADVVGVVVGDEHVGQAHPVGAEDLDQLVHAVRGIDRDGLACLPIADEVDEVHHLLRDLVVAAKSRPASSWRK